MSSFLPSEVSRLVLGYLDEVQCDSAYQAFLNDCPYLAECRGRVFFTRIMGFSLVEILDDFCAVQEYLVLISRGEEFKKKVLNCKSLLEKVKLFVDGEGESSNLSSTKHISSGPRKGHTHASVPKVSHSYSVHRSNRVRSNSCDSVAPSITEISPVAVGRPLDRRQKHARSMESVAEATNLSDLPGNKNYSVACQTKSYNNSGFYKNQSFKESINRSSRSVKYEPEEETFRSALGLVRNSELLERHMNISSAKTPTKAKISSRKQGVSVKKVLHVPDPLPNESLDVTTITHALLDCTEFHEKLAENINKIYSNLSASQIGDEAQNEVTLTCKNAAENVSKEDSKNGNKSMTSTTVNLPVSAEDNGAEELPQLDSVIKSIVEKTEKDPIFDQLVNEVLAASVETSSVSDNDSDMISRPGTSTPEKSSLSQMNESSPTHWTMHDTMDYSGEKHSRSRLGNKKIHQDFRYKSRIHRISPFKHCGYNQNQYYSRNKKYQRFPTGGKRMDILRETYVSSFCENESEKLPSVVKHHKNSLDKISEPASKIQNSKPEPKVTILSDEIVNVKPCKASLLMDSRKEIPHIVSVRKPEETIIKCKETNHSINMSQPTDVDQYKMTGIVARIQSYPDPRLQAKQSEPSDSSLVLQTVKSFENDSASSSNASNPVKFVNIEDNKTLPLYEMIPTSESAPDGSVYCQSNVKPNLRKFRKNSSLTMDKADCEKPTNFYSEADIMKMPTVFVDPASTLECTQSLVSEVPTISIPSNSIVPIHHSSENQVDLETKTNSNTHTVISSDSHLRAKLLYREKIPLKSVHSLISSMVNNTEGTHVLQIDGSLVGLNGPSNNGRPPQAEIILATKSESADKYSKEIVKPVNDMKSVENSGVVNSISNVNAEAGSADVLNVDMTDLSTPNDAIVSKNNGSTPRRSLSHVRVLDFNTPPKVTELRKVQSSPKMSTRSMDVPRKFLTPNCNMKPKSKISKTELFPVVEESHSETVDMIISAEPNSDVRVEVIASGVWDEVQGVGQILKKSNPVESYDYSTAIEPKPEDPKPNNKSKPEVKPVKKKVKVLKPVKEHTSRKSKIKTTVNVEPTDKQDKEFEDEAAALEWMRIRNANKKSWDQEMRLVLGSLPTVREPCNKKKKRKITNKCTFINLDDSDELSKSTEDEAKLLEDALNKTTGLTPAKVNETDQKSLEIIDDDCVKETSILEEQIDEHLNIENNSSQSDNGVNNKHYLLQVKLFRDSMKTQQVEGCKFVTYAKSHISDVESSAKKLKKPCKNKNTFKVKFTSKNSKEMQSPEEEPSDSDGGDDVSHKQTSHAITKVPEIVLTNAEGLTQEVSLPAVVEVPIESSAPGSSKEEPLLTLVEPPVPAVKITPIMPREPDSNPIIAKCNLNSLLETPFKFEILDLHMDTPKFISPGFFNNSFSGVKISDIPTPSFPFLPDLTKTPVSMNKEPTPGSYSSRPTDYSSSSSYYKPDEYELNLDHKNHSPTKKKPSKSLSIVKEEEEAESLSTLAEETCQRVLRPRRSRTIYYPDSVGKPKSDKNDSSTSSANKSVDNLNTSKSKSPAEESTPKPLPTTNVSQKAKPEKSPVKPLTETSFKKNSRFDDDLHLPSTSNSFMVKNFAAVLKNTSTPYISIENHKSQGAKRQLEEKRQRVLSKLKKTQKSSSHSKRKVSIQGKRVSNKLTVTRTSVSPKLNTSRSNKSVSSSNTTLGKEAKEEIVNSSKENTVLAPAAKSNITKSRRKSSTPRKLLQSEINSLMSPSESISDGDHNIEIITCQSKTMPNVAIKENVLVEKDEIGSSNVVNIESVRSVSMDVLENSSLSSEESVRREEDSKKSVSQSEGGILAIDVGDDYVTLHLSSDEVDAEPCNKVSETLEKNVPSTELNDIDQIRQFIATTSKDLETDDAAFRNNLIKQGFNPKSVNAIEKELLGAQSSDDEFDTSEKNSKYVEKNTSKNISKDEINKENTEKLAKPTVDQKQDKISDDHRKSNRYKSDDRHHKHKSSKDRHKSHYRPISYSKTLHKMSALSKSHKTPQKSQSKLSLRRTKENSHSSVDKVSKDEKKRKDESKIEEFKDKKVDKTNESNDKNNHVNRKESISPIIENTVVVDNVDVNNKDNNLENGAVPETSQDVAVKAKEESLNLKNELVEEDKQVDNQSDQEEYDEVVVWSNYDCDSSSKNFISHTYVSSKTKKKPVKVKNIDEFVIKASVLNSLTDKEEIRDIKTTINYVLIDVSPDKSKLRRIRYKEASDNKKIEKTEAAKKVAAKNPLERMFEEMVNATETQSSSRSSDEIRDPNMIAETDLAVRNLLIEESSNNAFVCSPSKYNSDTDAVNDCTKPKDNNFKDKIADDGDPGAVINSEESDNKISNDKKTSPKKQKVTSEECVIEQSNFRQAIAPEIPAKSSGVIKEKSAKFFDAAVEMPMELSEKVALLFGITGTPEKSFDLSKTTSKSGDSVSNNSLLGESNLIAEKRKRNEDHETDDLGAKKNKLSSPQSLLRKIDIDAVLSKLHGPE